VIPDISIAPGELPEPPSGSEPEPECLYHYTDVGGLLGIVKNKCLWASDVWFMNDAREAQYGLDVIERVLISRVPASDTEREVLRKAADLLPSLREQDAPYSYIACLSKEEDQLSQWRAYGRPRGFSIGFDRRKLQSLYSLGLELGKPTYRNVSYDVTVQEGMINMWLQTALGTPPASTAGSETDTAAWTFLMNALILIPAFKHPAFAEEREVRLQIYHGPDVMTPNILQFRSGAMGVTPYIEISLKDSGTEKMTMMREVIVGPQHSQEEARRAVRQLLTCYGLKDVEVRPSKIPLRP
jgi:hypothetical protein